MTVAYKSTMYGPGCGHPVGDGAGGCCCCNRSHNDPNHVRGCDRCRPVIDTFLRSVGGGE